MEHTLDTACLHATYGIWEVWYGELPPEAATEEEREEEYQFVGVYKGFADDIGFRLTGNSSPRPVAYSFRQAGPDAVPCDTPDTNPADICLIDIELPNGDCVSWKPATIPEYFVGRPVTADLLYGAVRLSRLDSEFGKSHAARKSAVDAILAKLSETEVQTLVEHGLTLHTY